MNEQNIRTVIFNRENLLKLATYLLSDNVRWGFNMACFDAYGGDGMYKMDCGAVGCAVGQGPYAGIVKLPHETWIGYSERAFISVQVSEPACYSPEWDWCFAPEWDWCFAPDWKHVDNSPQGAAKRILYLLRTGSVPEDHARQKRGEALLSYLNETL